MTDDIGSWLTGLGLSKYANTFVENEIDLEALAHLTDADLKEIGVALGARRKILAAKSQLADTDSGSVPDADPVREPTAERRHLTVMFVDLVGSTELAGRLDPEDMRGVITAYQNTVADGVTRFEGHVAKYMGDGVLAYFGWPLAHENDAERSVRAALAIIKALKRQADSGGMTVAARIGIATGLVVVGDLVGEGAAQEEAVIGETPNLAARLQGAAAPSQVVVSDATRRLLGDLFEFDALGTLVLKGIADPIDAYTVLAERETESRYSARQSTLPLIGRERELALILDRWDQVKAGEGQMVLLTGEAGIGKSHVACAAVDAMAAGPHQQITYQCSVFHGGSAFYPAIQEMMRAAGFAKDDDAEARLDRLEIFAARSSTEPRTVMPFLASLLGLPVEARYGKIELTPERQRARTLQLLSDQIIGLSKDQPVHLVVEDAHWIDPTTRELIELTLDKIADKSVLILVTARPEFEKDFTDHPIITRLALNRLGRNQVIGILESLTHGKTLPSEVISEIMVKTDGIPLFVEELTKTVLEADYLRATKDAYVLDAPLDRLAIPGSLHDSLLARLDRLGPAREVAQNAACIGREFDYRLIADISSHADDRLRDALEQVVGAEILFRRGDPPDAIYAFKHALVRDAAYESLLKTKREHLHGQIADALEANFPERAELEPEFIAWHFAEGRRIDKAIVYCQRALDHAQHGAATREIVGQATRALDLLMETPESPDRDRIEFDFQTALGSALQMIEGWASPRALPAFERVLELGDRMGDTTRQLDGLRLIYNYHWGRRRYKDAYEAAEKMILAATEAGDDSGLMVGKWLRAEMHLCRGDLAAARSDLEEAAALDPVVGASSGPVWSLQDALTQVLGALALVLWLMGYPCRSRQISDRAVARARELGDKPYALAMALYLSLERGILADPTAVDQKKLLELLGLAEEHGFAQWSELAMLWQSFLELLQAPQPAEARDYRRRRETRTKALAAGAVHGCCALSVQEKTGDAEGELAFIDELLKDAAAHDERVLEAEFHRQRGELLFAVDRGEAARAETQFQTALAIASQQQARAFELRAATSLARLWARQGAQERAREVLAPVYASFTEGFETADLRQAQALLEQL